MTRIVPALRGGGESRRGYLCITARAGIGKETGVESVDAVPIETPARLGGGTRTSRRVQLGPGYKRVAVERRSRYNL